MVKGLVALVTGGASGLGKATVEKFVKEGSKVVICDIQKGRGEEIANNLGSDVTFVPTDVTSPEEVNTALSITKESFNKLDVVVNCAGISIAFKTFNFRKKNPHDLEDFIRVMMANTVGTFNVIRLSMALMGDNPLNEDKQRGVIINTSSFAAYDGQCGQVAYAASKAAIAGMTLPLARDFATDGIRVCAIAPGLFDTPLNSQLPDKVKAFLAKSTLSPQRFGKPEEFANLVMHIVKNPFINGEVIRLDGGLRIL